MNKVVRLTKGIGGEVLILVSTITGVTDRGDLREVWTSERQDRPRWFVSESMDEIQALLSFGEAKDVQP